MGVSQNTQQRICLFSFNFWLIWVTSHCPTITAHSNTAEVKQLAFKLFAKYFLCNPILFPLSGASCANSSSSLLTWGDLPQTINPTLIVFLSTTSSFVFFFFLTSYLTILCWRLFDRTDRMQCDRKKKKTRGDGAWWITTREKGFEMSPHSSDTTVATATGEQLKLELFVKMSQEHFRFIRWAAAYKAREGRGGIKCIKKQQDELGKKG